MALFGNRKSKGRTRAGLRKAHEAAKTTRDVAEVAGLAASFIPGVGGAAAIAAKAVEKGADAAAKKTRKALKNKARRERRQERGRVYKQGRSLELPAAPAAARASGGMSTGAKVGLAVVLLGVGAVALRRRRS